MYVYIYIYKSRPLLKLVGLLNPINKALKHQRGGQYSSTGQWRLVGGVVVIVVVVVVVVRVILWLLPFYWANPQTSHDD